MKTEKILDAILSYLRISRSRLLLTQILNELKINATKEELEYFESKLINAEVVHIKTMSHQRKLFSINEKGIQFIQEGGFSKEKIWKTIGTVKEVIEIFKP